MQNYHQCNLQLFVFSTPHPPLFYQGHIFCCNVENSYYTVDEFVALFGPKGISIL